MFHTQNTFFDYIHNQQQRFIEDLFDFLRIPSVSADSGSRKNIDDCALFLVRYLTKIGLTARLIPSKSYPVVYAEFVSDPALPTVLIYGHYDVQPADPLDLWASPPFEPVIRDGNIFARGVSDDKGQIFCHICAVGAYLAQHQKLPVNVKFLVEGEEEIGTPHLAQLVQENMSLLKADLLLVSDTCMYGVGEPSITYSLRGLCYLEVIVKGPKADLHSGQHGGVVLNPIQALAELIFRLKDADGHILIPHFYDDVIEIPSHIRDSLNQLHFDDVFYQRELGVTHLVGEKGYSTLEKRWFRPTLDCNGIVGGYIGEGSKTIIPSYARAKISMRLVAHQDPHIIFQLAKTYLQSICPVGVTLEFMEHAGGKPVYSSLTSAGIQAATRALQIVYGKPPIFQGDGATIPIVRELQDRLHLESVLLGFNLPDDQIHAPNERFSIENFMNGIRVSACFLEEMGRG